MGKYIITFILFCFMSCSSDNRYEKLISDYVQTDKSGVWTDLQFKIVELKENAPLTVSDSIVILKEDFEADNAIALNRFETLLNLSIKNLEKEEKSRFRSQLMIDEWTGAIAGLNNSIDSVKQLPFVSKYDGLAPDKVLLLPVECRYSYVFPASNPRQERTDIFYFLPDKNKIIAKKQVKNK